MCSKGVLKQPSNDDYSDQNHCKFLEETKNTDTMGLVSIYLHLVDVLLFFMVFMY